LSSGCLGRATLCFKADRATRTGAAVAIVSGSDWHRVCRNLRSNVRASPADGGGRSTLESELDT
jgi:hypothetical protein